MTRSAGLLVVLALGAVLPACHPASSTAGDEAPAPQPVRTATVRVGTLQPELSGLGTVRPTASAELLSPTSGRVSYPPRFAAGLRSGARVERGELVATLDDPRVAQEVSEARVLQRAAQTELERHRRAFSLGIESAAQLAQFEENAELADQRLAAAEQRLRSLGVRSPLSGFLVVDRVAPPGAEVGAGALLGRVLGGGGLVVRAALPASDLSQLRPGLAVHFLPGKGGSVSGTGTVRDIDPEVSAGGTFAVTIEVTDPTGLPAPGEGVAVQIELDRREQVLIVPIEALAPSPGGATSVFVVDRQAGLRARLRPITIGDRDAKGVEVRSGLAAGERVVTSGIDFIVDGAEVTEAAEPGKGG